VSILRAGEALEEALVTVCKDVKIGKILIQTNKNTTEPEVCLFIFLLLTLIYSVSRFTLYSVYIIIKTLNFLIIHL